MQKAETNNFITVSVARFGHGTQVLQVPEGSTVDYVLQMTDLELDGNEEMFVEGEKATGSDILENNDILSVVTPKQAG